MKNPKLDQDWLQTPLGTYLLDREQAYFDATVADIFGFYAVQLGMEGVDFLRNSRIPERLCCGHNAPAKLFAEPMFLPFATQSVDLLILPHVLEYSDHPHQVLREAERVLRPEGRLLISGFNPRSLWGLVHGLKGAEAGFPWNGHLLNAARVKDWLALLGFELSSGRMCCYRPPINREGWLRRFRFMELAGDKWWNLGGGVYFLQAIKRVHGMRLITPTWKAGVVRAAPSLAASKVLNFAKYKSQRDRQ